MTQAKKTKSKKDNIATLDDAAHMDIVMINALLESLLTLFSTMVNLKIVPGVPIPKQGNVSRGGVTGLIGMKANDAHGSVSLSLTLPTIRKISFSLFGEEISSINNEAKDLAGELTNMLVGGAKRILSEKGHDFDMQSPQLMMGEGHEIVHLSPGQTVLLPIEIDQDEFYLELNFASSLNGSKTCV